MDESSSDPPHVEQTPEHAVVPNESAKSAKAVEKPAAAPASSVSTSDPGDVATEKKKPPERPAPPTAKPSRPPPPKTTPVKQ